MTQINGLMPRNKINKINSLEEFEKLNPQAIPLIQLYNYKGVLIWKFFLIDTKLYQLTYLNDASWIVTENTMNEMIQKLKNNMGQHKWNWCNELNFKTPD